MIDNCLICFKDIQKGITLYEYIMKQDCICGICRKQFEVCDQIIKVEGLEIHALYYYNDFFENNMFTYKENQDVALAKVFLFPYIKKLEKKYKDYTLAFAPSSKEKESERGFSSLSLLFQGIRMEKLYLFEKTKPYKQSSQPYHKRELVHDVIKRNGQSLPNNKILLVDDMCTSGATLRSMYELIRDHTYDIAIFTIGINRRLLKDQVGKEMKK